MMEIFYTLPLDHHINNERLEFMDSIINLLTKAFLLRNRRGHFQTDVAVRPDIRNPQRH